MLFETLLQGKMFLVMLYFGIICGIIFSAKRLFDGIFKQNKAVVIITDILFMAVTSIIFVFAKIKFCYGEFRLFELLSFCLGIFLEQISLNNFVEKFLKLCYNLFKGMFCKLKNTKLFGKILK